MIDRIFEILNRGEKYTINKKDEKEVWECKGSDKYLVSIYNDDSQGYTGAEMSRKEAIAWIKYDLN
ncbi:hypothetical protein HMPREF1092_03197 [Clostridium thermobutyricum]|uniref:Uncharacterized protein n=1 Tax=Clostridium thermobutyricum TaxID=29372 RepID=N9XV20_9CLOT|nr:hypothetical protein [Clostridium thermobutyricum]ENY99456.1 hypothetical protein HMPREF1092_03197 [Clostridium thermobutyricum]